MAGGVVTVVPALRILICDDNVLLGESLAARFRNRGHTLAVTQEPNAALGHLEAHGADLCLMDLRFPNAPTGGLAAIALIRKRAPGTTVILLSGAVDDGIAAEAIRAGAHGVARKDITLGALERAVAKAASGAALLPRDIVGARHPVHLTAQEQRVSVLLADGLTTEQISTELGVARSTVRGYVQAILSKLDVHNRLHAGSLLRLQRDPPRPNLGSQS